MKKLKEYEELYSRQAQRKLHRERVEKFEINLKKIVQVPEDAKQSRSLLGVSDF